MSFNFTTAYDLVEIKLNRNNAIKELMETEIIILQKRILINHRLVKNTNWKIGLIDSINEYEEQQKFEYCLDRESVIADLTNQVNEASTNTDMLPLCEDITKLMDKVGVLLTKINELNAQIPDQTIITNYKFSSRTAAAKPSDCHNSAQ